MCGHVRRFIDCHHKSMYRFLEFTRDGTDIHKKTSDIYRTVFFVAFENIVYEHVSLLKLIVVFRLID